MISGQTQNHPRTASKRFQNEVRPASRRLGAEGWRLEAESWRQVVWSGWTPKVGGWRLEAGGWRLEAGGWRLKAGGWSSAARFGAVRCGVVRCGAAASRRALLIFSILHLHTSPVVSGNLLCRECQFLVIKSRIQAKNLTFPLRHFELRPQSKDIAAPKNANSRSQKWGQKTYAFSTPTSDLHC